MLTKERIKVLKDVKKLTTQKIKFYVQSHQFWFKNLDTQLEYPLPIALLDDVVQSEDGSEKYRVSMQLLQQYVESEHKRGHLGKR